MGRAFRTIRNISPTIKPTLTLRLKVACTTHIRFCMVILHVSMQPSLSRSCQIVQWYNIIQFWLYLLIPVKSINLLELLRLRPQRPQRAQRSKPLTALRAVPWACEYDHHDYLGLERWQWLLVRWEY